MSHPSLRAVAIAWVSQRVVPDGNSAGLQKAPDWDLFQSIVRKASGGVIPEAWGDFEVCYMLASEKGNGEHP
jgi:hypothetical protein